jgi:hypothetical protein
MQPNGSETSSTPDISRPATLMSDQSLTCEPTISVATPNAISSPESDAGPMRSGLPDGPMIAPSGPAPARVSRFRARDSGKAMPISDTSGPLFMISSPSAALQSSLESKLRARTDVNGSPEYGLTWKYWDMPAGLPICALRASARPISDSGFIGWPTPNRSDFKAGFSNVLTRSQSSLPRTIAKLFGLEGGKRGTGNLRFLSWLMGIPQMWLQVRPSETPSFLKSQRNLSEPRATTAK